MAQSTFASGFPRTCPRQSRHKRWFRRCETLADAMDGGADGRAAERRDPGFGDRRGPDRQRRPTRRHRACRDVSWRPDASCDLATVAALAARHPDVRQFVVLATAGFAAHERHRVRRRSWTRRGVAMPDRHGRRQFRIERDPTARRPPLGRRHHAGRRRSRSARSRRGTARRSRVFGNSPDPGVRSNVTYRAVRNEDCWGATAGTARYNHLVNLPNCSGPDDEWLPRFGDVYSHAAVIGANLDPVSGDAPGEIAVRRGDLPPPSLVHRRRPGEAHERLRLARRTSTSSTFLRLLDPALGTALRHRPDRPGSASTA